MSTLVSLSVTVASAPGAIGPYGAEGVVDVKLPAASELTVPLCGTSDQLWTLTGKSIVSPITIVASAAERPMRSAAGAVLVIQLSYSAHLPKRW